MSETQTNKDNNKQLPILNNVINKNGGGLVTSGGIQNDEILLNDRMSSDNDSSEDGDNVAQNNNSYLSSTLNISTKSSRANAQRASRRNKGDWDIVGGFHDDIIPSTVSSSNKAVGNNYNDNVSPPPKEGFIAKRRRWPMKGWHKRYFLLDRGFLCYAKSHAMLSRGRMHGKVDIAMAVISYQRKQGRVDIDADSCVHHLKIKDSSLFESWLNALTEHRIHRQRCLSAPHTNATRTPSPQAIDSLDRSIEKDNQLTEDRVGLKTTTKETIATPNRSKTPVPTTSATTGAATTVNNESFESALVKTRKKIDELKELFKELEKTTQQNNGNVDVNKRANVSKSSSTATASTTSNASERKSYCDSLTVANIPTPRSLSQSSSNPNLNRIVSESVYSAKESRKHQRNNTETVITSPSCGIVSTPLIIAPNNTSITTNPATTTTASGSSEAKFVHGNFLQLAKEIVKDLENHTTRLHNEKKSSVSVAPLPATPNVNRLSRTAKPVSEEIRQKLIQIRYEMDSVLSNLTDDNYACNGAYGLHAKNSFSSRNNPVQARSFDTESTSEMFFDAEDRMSGVSISDNSSSETSDVESVENDSENDDFLIPERNDVTVLEANTGRRDHLPAPMPDSSDFSLMNLLRKNIGRDLSKVRLPVSLHEPLSALQRLCEELEYSELLDTAALLKKPIDRMVYVAAFAVSGYASSFYRSGTKPFNPVLGETYEIVREDKKWKYIAEQVSHHPPMTACHCTHEHWIWYQELRLKNKFWGKSLEAVPVGHIHLKFPNLNETYRWNKVTTCVHNLFGGKRSIEHYGDMRIESSSGMLCQLTFHRGTSTWMGTSTGQRYQVSGKVTSAKPTVGISSNINNQTGTTTTTTSSMDQRQLFGRWNEGIYCGHDNTAKCIWRPGAMPADHELYYGFTRFAIELNHLDPGLESLLPCTDSRFRPDQRLLENGDVDNAEKEKFRIEDLQRKRISQLPGGKEDNWAPLWFKHQKRDSDGVVSNNISCNSAPFEECQHEFDGDYWRVRDEKGGFINKNLPKLW